MGKWVGIRKKIEREREREREREMIGMQSLVTLWGDFVLGC
jgi:hypothetical protein